MARVIERKADRDDVFRFRRRWLDHQKEIGMKNFGEGVVCGIVATAVMSVLMLMKSAMGFMPQLDVIQMQSTMMGVFPVMAWVVHFGNVGARG